MPESQIDRWLQGPDRNEFKWEISFSFAQRALERRYVLQVFGSIAQSKGALRDLHFLVKAAAADEPWAPGGVYTHIPGRAEFEGIDIPVTGSVYLRPGPYKLAVIAYDSTNAKLNVMRKRVDLPSLKPEPVPELDDGLPDIEYVSGKPRFVSTWLSGSKAPLPVNNSRPLCIDVIASITQPYNSAPLYPNVLQLSSVLSRLRPREGKVRVSVIEPLQMHTFHDRTDTAELDWERVLQTVAAQDRSVIHADVIAAFTPGTYLAGHIEKILKDDQCLPGETVPAEIIMIVSRELRLSPMPPPIQKREGSQFLYFYLGGYADDDMPTLLRHTGYRNVSFTWKDPKSVRKALASVIATMEATK